MRKKRTSTAAWLIFPTNIHHSSLAGDDGSHVAGSASLWRQHSLSSAATSAHASLPAFFLFSQFPAVLDFLDQLLNDFVEAIVPVEMRTPSAASNRCVEALCILPDTTTLRTPAGSSKGIPMVPATALPLVVRLWFPFTFRTSYSHVAHDRKFVFIKDSKVMSPESLVFSP